jgi:hypothetical protein
MKKTLLFNKNIILFELRPFNPLVKNAICPVNHVNHTR